MGTSVELTDEQLVYLDARDDLSEKLRHEVKLAKARLAAIQRLSELAPEGAAFVADVISEAQRNGELIFLRTSMSSSCRVCGKKAEPIRYRSGRNRGMIKAWGTIAAVEFRESFVRVQNHVSIGACRECVTQLLPALRAELATVRAEVPRILAEPGRPLWKKWDLKRCKSCGWEGHEGKLGHVAAFISGYFRGKCPKCGVEQKPLGMGMFDQPKGFKVVKAKGGVCFVCDQPLREWSAQERSHRVFADRFYCARHEPKNPET